ncbi:MFS transporter (macronuclear) [Tetrahymena thermophila SB210]|uniref:MFS transporter n=1 Tax=Tetrahymena thermophila (strain SB210) TaxID=312017 RepID=W7XLP4_TETTS|nr:MFS transporter [Tetrahymena thermophila SB210]EWS76644.1 MFS transporter [Tetrahymena thermophila SB210]|eukprot:XP_012650812.1 MFS transporter [Tetrahymena thermophila SB210]
MEDKKTNCCRHWDFPSGPPPQYQPSLKALNFGVRMRSGVFTLVWPTTKLIANNNYQYFNIYFQIKLFIQSNRFFFKQKFKVDLISYIKKVVDTGTSQAVPHLSTNPALRRLTSEFEWDPVFSPQYGRQQNLFQRININNQIIIIYKNKKGCRHWDFPSGPPPQYQPSLKALNFGVRMGSGVFTLVWPTTKQYQLLIFCFILSFLSYSIQFHKITIISIIKLLTVLINNINQSQSI